MNDLLTLETDEGQAIVCALERSAEEYRSQAPGIVSLHWAGMAGASGYRDEVIAELLREDVDQLFLEGRPISFMLGRWHTLAEAEAERFVAWLDWLLEGAQQEPAGPRVRLSPLAA